MRARLLFLLVLVIFSSCEQETSKNFNGLKTFKLNRSNLAFTDNPLLSRFHKIDTLILARNADPNAEYLYTLFNLNHKKIFEIGEIGSAPDEFERSTYFSNIKKDSITKLYLYQRNSNKVSIIDLKRSYIKRKTHLLQNIDIKTKIIPNDVIALNDHQFIYNPSNVNLELENKRYYLNQLIGSDNRIKFNKYSEPKNKSANFLFYNYNYLYTSSIYKNPSKNLFCQLFVNQNRIEIFNKKLQTLKSLQLKPEIDKLELKKLQNHQEGDNISKIKIKQRLFPSFVDQKFIWLNTSEDYLFKKDPEDNSKHNIILMDWELKPVCKLVVNHNITNFTVIKEKNKLLIYDYDNEEIVDYNIEKVLDYINKL